MKSGETPTETVNPKYLNPSLFHYSDGKRRGDGMITTLEMLTNDCTKELGRYVDNALLPLIVKQAVTYSIAKRENPTDDQRDQINAKTLSLLTGTEPEFKIRREDISDAISTLNELVDNYTPANFKILRSARDAGRAYLNASELDFK